MMIDTLFGSALAADATYTAPSSGAVAVAVRVIRRTESSDVPLGLAGTMRPANAYDVRVSDLPSPEEGGALAIGQATYLVRSYAPDEQALVWMLDLDPA